MGQHILVVDDDKQIARLVRSYLEQAGYQVQVAYEGGTALELIRHEHPDLVVTPFMHDHLVVIVAPNDDWADRAEVDLDAVRGRVLLTREPGSALHATVERLLGAAILAGESVIQLGETEAIKRSVEAGLGVALIQGIAIEREVTAGNLRALRLRGGDDSRTYAYAHRRQQRLSSAVESFIHLLPALP